MEDAPPPTRTLNPDGETDAGRQPLVTADLAPGVGVDRYVILQPVGRGGMGVVYAAYDPSLDRRVALKFLNRTDEELDGRHEKRLLREAQAMARLSHPNVAVVYEVGLFQGRVFLAMEFVNGMDLRSWLSAPRRSAREILDVFLAAGRGLAAAHAAGIIHRDFKPENVLVDRQDRPRVTDFGLSRAAPEPGDDVETWPEAPASLSPRSHLSSPLTRTDAVVGTPPYMSPEQHLGKATDERSDQFSFCLALYEALHGERPFKGESQGELLDSMLAGRISPAPASSTAPRRWRQAIGRGLDPVPDRRFASMDALLAALSRDPRRRRRHIVVGAVVALGLVGLGAGYRQFLATEAGAPGPRCDLGATRLAGAWDEPARHRLREAFERSGVPGVDAAWRSFAAVLDQRAGAWAAMHNQACAATHVDGVQSAGVLDLRMECLDRKLQEMVTLVEVYSDTPDAKMIDRATSAADNLSLISACADVANLRARVPLPERREERARVDSLRQRLTRARALREAGRFEHEREQLAALKRDADATGYAPVAAEATRLLGESASSDAPDEAEKLLFEAADLAVKGRDWTLEAETWVSIITSYGRQGRVHEGLVAARAAELALARANADDALRARLMGETGWMEYKANRYREALVRYQAAERLWSASLGTGSSQYAGTLQRIGITLGTLGRIRESVAYLERGLAVRRAILRPDHVDIAAALVGLGQAYSYLGRHKAEREAFRAAHAIFLKERGPDDRMTRSTQRTLASAEADLGNHARALELYEDTAREAIDPRDISGGLYHVVHADIQYGAGLYEEAERSLNQAMQHYATAGFPEHVNTGYARTGLGLLHVRRRQFREGVRECRRALAIFTKEMDPASHLLSETRACIGDGLIGVRDFDAARVELELALRSAKDGECAPLVIGTLRFHLARALWPARRDRARAVELARSALQTLEAAETDTREIRARVAAWLTPRSARTARR